LHRAAATSLLAAAVLAGCGDDEEAERRPVPEENRVVAAARELQTAMLDGDAEAFCRSLAPEAERRFIARLGEEGGGCVETAKDVYRRRRELAEQTALAIEPLNVRATGSRAVLRLTNGERVRFRKSGGRWLVASPPF
jgi:hypothetical protein